jgi:hypothetical protein
MCVLYDAFNQLKPGFLRGFLAVFEGFRCPSSTQKKTENRFPSDQTP